MSVGTFTTGLLDWFNKEIIVESFNGTYTLDGQPNRGAGVTMQCRIDETVRKVTDMQGEERVSTTTLYVAGGPLSPLDKITMPASFKGPSHPPIINVSNLDDIAAFDHAEVYI